MCHVALLPPQVTLSLSFDGGRTDACRIIQSFHNPIHTHRSGEAMDSIQRERDIYTILYRYCRADCKKCLATSFVDSLHFLLCGQLSVACHHCSWRFAGGDRVWYVGSCPSSMPWRIALCVPIQCQLQRSDFFQGRAKRQPAITTMEHQEDTQPSVCWLARNCQASTWWWNEDNASESKHLLSSSLIVRAQKRNLNSVVTPRPSRRKTSSVWRGHMPIA